MGRPPRAHTLAHTPQSETERGREDALVYVCIHERPEEDRGRARPYVIALTRCITPRGIRCKIRPRGLCLTSAGVARGSCIRGRDGGARGDQSVNMRKHTPGAVTSNMLSRAPISVRRNSEFRFIMFARRAVIPCRLRRAPRICMIGVMDWSWGISAKHYAIE